jgi:glycosyltransferase involved in cell wall biosynthesis
MLFKIIDFFMHILFYFFEYPPFSSGVGAYMKNMAQCLVAAGHRATVVTQRYPGMPEVSIEAGITVYRCYSRNEVRQVRITKKVLAIAKELRVDWIEGADHMGECAALMQCSPPVPIVIKAHTCNVLKVGRDALCLYPWQKPLLWLAIFRSIRQFLAERQSLINADLLLAPSQRIIDEFRRQKLNLPKKVIHIPNPISFGLSLPKIVESNEKRILFAGRICFGKGVHVLPAMMESLKKSDTILDIAGADSFARGIGSVKKWLENKFGKNNRQINFLGRVDPIAMSQVIQRARVIIVPSRWDNFPTIILEAMKYGRPVVSSTCGGMAEMLEGTGCPSYPLDGEEFVQAVMEIVSNQEKAALLGKKMQEKLLQAYSPNIVLPQYLKALSCNYS